MKKLVRFLIIILFVNNLNSQKQIEINYSLAPIVSTSFKFHSLIKEISPNYENLVKKIQLQLIIQKDTSYFFTNKSSVIDDDGVKMFLALSSYSGLIIQKNDSIFRESNFEHFGKKYVVADTVQKNWKLINETKDIMGYKCYKAETTNVVVNDKGIFKNPVYAWYFPEFPYQFGPLGYGKLPGLIFELQTKNAIFGVISISTNSNLAVIPKFDKKAEYISNKDLNDLVHKLHQKRSDIVRE